MAELNPRLHGLLTEYAAATKTQEVAQRKVDELGAKRAQLLARMHEETGLSYQKLAGVLAAIGMPMSAARIQAMAKRAGDNN